MIAVSCSLSQCGSRSGEIKPVSEICVERLDNNWLPLESTAKYETVGGVIIARFSFYSKNCLCTSYPILVVENPGQCSVLVNDQEVAPMKGLHLLEDDDACYELGGRVLDGKNAVVVNRSWNSAPAEMPSAFIAGDFDVLPDEENVWLLTSAKVLGLGSLESQGMPFYSSDVSYSRTFEVTGKVRKRTFLRLGEWKGTLCEVWVNGEKAGDIPAGHHKLKIGSFLNPGMNELELHVRGDGLYEEFTIY
jgi:hypothetical protein